MTAFKVTLEYEGTRYSGWQEQTGAKTVLGELRKAAVDVFGVPALSSRFLEMQGAGRTDAGVHALAQVMHVKVSTGTRHSPETIMRRMNELLPADIVVLSVEPVPRSFHARHDAISRGYLYQISRRKQAFRKKNVWWIKEHLNVDAMTRAARMLPGRHDFICFRAADSARPDESTIVVVANAEIEADDDIIQFRIEASHFLWRMVRRIVGVLVKVGKGEITEAEFAQLLDGRGDPRLDVAAWTAPASGLFLEGVRYEGESRI